jgi:hypothetical protein
MTNYRVNQEAVAQARTLIDAGKVDTDTGWSEAAPSTAESNEEIDEQDWQAYGRWHLAVDLDATENTKGRYRFPYGDFSRVNRSALIHAKQRASQNDHKEITEAADELLQRLDGNR